MSGHFLIVEARFYDALADAQVEGATRAHGVGRDLSRSAFPARLNPGRHRLRAQRVGSL